MDKSRLGAGRPVRSWGIKAPRNSLKTPENSRKSSLTQRPGSPAAQHVPRAQQSNSETPVKKLRFLPFLFSICSGYTGRARWYFPGNLRNKIRRKQGKIFAFHLDLPGSRCIYIPGRDTNEYPEDIERTEMLDFLLGILLPLKLLLLAWAAWQLLGWLL